MKRDKLVSYVLIIVIAVTVVINKNQQTTNIEEEEIHVGTGYSIKKNGDEISDYEILLSAYTFESDDKIDSVGNMGVANTIGKTRQDRQNKNPRKYTTGFQKVFVIDEEYSFQGIRTILDIVFKHPMINIEAYCVVCKGKSSEYLTLKSKGYDSSSDFIAGMIKNTKDSNFLGENYSMRDLFIICDSEGRNIVLPYIDIIDKQIELAGMSIFNKDKLVKVLDMDEGRIMNILRENKTKGMLTIEQSYNGYTNYYTKCERKVKCTKNGEKYSFVIDLKFKGDIVNNLLYKDISSDLKVTKKFEEDMAKKIESKANAFIQQMKTNYKVDCLELGRFAVAKYGRHTGVDWNEVVSNSDIKVNVSVQVSKVGRGDY